MTRSSLISIAFILATATVCAQESSSVVQENIDRAKERLGDRLLTTADAVIARHVEAVGGRDAILSVKTLMFRGAQLSLVPGEPMLYRYYKQPNLLRVSRTPKSTSYTLSDGEKVWSVTPEGRRELDAWWAKSLSHHRIDDNFIDYAKRGIGYEYIGLEGFETDRAVYYHLRRSFPDGVIEELYFDVETGLLYGIWPTSSPRKNDPCFYYDYRDAGGILIPHAWARVFDKASPPHVLIIDEVRINEDFGEGFFSEYKEVPIRE